MRGKVPSLNSLTSPYRITPAYAGKRPYVPHLRHLKEDHPRLCGEKDLTLIFKSLKIGSPPPMRGKDNLFPQNRINHRITPAYAGKSY